MSQKIVWKVKTYNWTVVVEANSVAKAEAKAKKVLRSKYDSPNPTIESIERVGELES
ncbi:MAG TPA: hypothetical protein VN654_05370 [Vicinamibacterales bacterium]|nr:hypothetical protein [Vicinamibacterales bacterium]